MRFVSESVRTFPVRARACNGERKHQVDRNSGRADAKHAGISGASTRTRRAYPGRWTISSLRAQVNLFAMANASSSHFRSASAIATPHAVIQAELVPLDYGDDSQRTRISPPPAALVAQTRAG